MFTGIIEGFGTIAGIRSSGKGKNLAIEADFEPDRTKIGDSIAVSGACLTVVVLDGKLFNVDVSPETLSKTTFGKVKIGDRVNLERALRLGDRLDGHLVSGHIDGMGTIRNRKNESNAIIITISVPHSLSRYMIKKGSVAVDGISLTINDCDKESFSVSIIPHTAKLTTIGLKKIGETVNIETDMIGKYVERFVIPFNSDAESMNENKESGKIDMNFLMKNGFL